jgi:heat shock protein HtpX
VAAVVSLKGSAGAYPGPVIFGPLVVAVCGTFLLLAVRSNRHTFRASLRVQAAGLVSLLLIPAILALAAWGLVAVSAVLAVIVGLVFLVGLQIVIGRRIGTLHHPPSAVEASRLDPIVERLCTAADLSRPRVALHDRPYANSWVRGTRRPTLHLTRELLALLDERQLEAVIAHELAHIGQRDAALMSLVGTPVSVLTEGAGFYVRGYGEMRRRRDELAEQFKRATVTQDEKAARAMASDVVAQWAEAWLLLLPLGLAFLALAAVLGPTTAVFSRSRELEADAGAAALTGNPSALASALIALDAPRGPIPLKDLRAAESADVFHIIAIGRERGLMRTHPRLERRLAQLAAIERRLQLGRDK